MVRPERVLQFGSSQHAGENTEPPKTGPLRGSTKLWGGSAGRAKEVSCEQAG